MGLQRWQDLPEAFEVDAEARTARLERRVSHVLRELGRRIAEVESLEAEVTSLRAELEKARRHDGDVPGRVLVDSAELDALRAAAHERDALMSTRTFRLFRFPRALYGLIRRALGSNRVV